MKKIKFNRDFFINACIIFVVLALANLITVIYIIHEIKYFAGVVSFGFLAAFSFILSDDLK